MVVIISPSGGTEWVIYIERSLQKVSKCEQAFVPMLKSVKFIAAAIHYNERQ